MTIVIRTEKVVPPNGIQSRKILGCEGLDRDDTPDEYRCGYPSVSITKQGDIWVYPPKDSYSYMEKGTVYTEATFQRHLAVIREAGHRLTEINARVRKLREEWKGEETFVI